MIKVCLELGNKLKHLVNSNLNVHCLQIRIKGNVTVRLFALHTDQKTLKSHVSCSRNRTMTAGSLNVQFKRVNVQHCSHIPLRTIQPVPCPQAIVDPANINGRRNCLFESSSSASFYLLYFSSKRFTC